MARVEKRKQGYYAVLDVPRALQPGVGKKQLVQSLHTRDRATAHAASRRVLADLQGIIDAARRPPAEAVMGEADGWRESVLAARRGEQAVTGADADDDQEAFIQGLIEDRAGILARKHGADVGAAFAAVATGRATPLLHHLADWLHEGGQKGSFKDRTKVGHRRHLALLAGWMKAAKLAATIEVVGRQVAGRFVTECLARSGRDPKTIASIVSSCRAYWTYLLRKGLAEGEKNPWDDQAPPKAASKGSEDDRARAFTDDEVCRLLAGPASPELADVMRVAALSGMRIDEAYSLTVRDCTGSVFTIRASKTKAGVRHTPIHPGLVGIVARRSRDKAAKDYLFHEAGPLKPDRERSMVMSKRFGRYRQLPGMDVHEKVSGKRNSRVTFHSFRHWFITAALRAGQPLRVAQQVVGHKLQGMTLGVYFDGDPLEALQACVEAVSLPSGPPMAPKGPR